jgi:tetratricopeptide (TPR) repeat protein
MPDPSSQAEHVSDVDTALLDAELFLKYKAPDRAIKRLRSALEGNPRSIPLRERMREVCIEQKQNEEAARQSLGLASLYIEREDFDSAYDRLLEAKQLDARINIAGGLEAIRRARRPDLRPHEVSTPSPQQASHATLVGDLSAISVFDAIQVIENAKLTGTLLLTSDNSTQTGCVLFNEGIIADAEAAGVTGEQGFRGIVEITTGSFEFQKSAQTFPSQIKALSNTNLILDTLSQLDEEKR